MGLPDPNPPPPSLQFGVSGPEPENLHCSTSQVLLGLLGLRAHLENRCPDRHLLPPGSRTGAVGGLCRQIPKQPCAWLVILVSSLDLRLSEPLLRALHGGGQSCPRPTPGPRAPLLESGPELASNTSSINTAVATAVVTATSPDVPGDGLLPAPSPFSLTNARYGMITVAILQGWSGFERHRALCSWSVTLCKCDSRTSSPGCDATGVAPVQVRAGAGEGGKPRTPP